MGLLSKLTKGGVAAKAANEARKPRNQARIKGLVSRLTSRSSRRA